MLLVCLVGLLVAGALVLIISVKNRATLEYGKSYGESWYLVQRNSLGANYGILSPSEALVWIEAKRWNLDYEKIHKLITCESSWNPQAKGDKGKAYGLLQFWKSTFDAYSQKYGYTNLEYTSSTHQILLAMRMISEGERANWTCAKYQTYASK